MRKQAWEWDTVFLAVKLWKNNLGASEMDALRDDTTPCGMIPKPRTSTKEKGSGSDHTYCSGAGMEVSRWWFLTEVALISCHNWQGQPESVKWRENGEAPIQWNGPRDRQKNKLLEHQLVENMRSHRRSHPDKLTWKMAEGWWIFGIKTAISLPMMFPEWNCRTSHK